jgi:hypothetical protein
MDLLSEESEGLDFDQVFVTAQGAVNAIFGAFYPALSFVLQIVTALSLTYSVAWIPWL